MPESKESINPTQTPPEAPFFALPRPLRDGLLAFLGTQPYNSVARMVVALQTLQPLIPTNKIPSIPRKKK